MNYLKIISVIFVLNLGLSSQAKAQALTVYAAEMGIGKFHRYDNSVHPYSADNVWSHFILPAGSHPSPLTIENKDGSITIFFSSLEELLREISKVSDQKHMKVEILNLNAHGMPGAMWFPKDENTRKSDECSEWREAAEGNDRANYDQYYSPIAKSDIIQTRLLARLPSMQFLSSCTTGASQWRDLIEQNPAVKKAFSPGAQVHMFSCVVGLGYAGERYTKGLASALLDGEGARVETALNYGLGDWSMPEGMGFWDYIEDHQLERDNAIYPISRSDRDIMQRGQIRMTVKVAGDWKTGVIENLDFMLGGRDNLELSDKQNFEAPPKLSSAELQKAKNGIRFRIPHTKTFFTAKMPE